MPDKEATEYSTPVEFLEGLSKLEKSLAGNSLNRIDSKIEEEIKVDDVIYALKTLYGLDTRKWLFFEETPEEVGRYLI